MLKRLTGTYEYVFPLDPAVDLEKWGDKAKEYFVSDFSRPPIKEGEKATIWTIQPLTGKQMRYVNERLPLDVEDDALNKVMNDVEFIDFVVGHGLCDIVNFDVAGFKLEREDSPYGGKRLTKETLDEIIPFQRVLAQVLVGEIISLSRCRYS